MFLRPHTTTKACAAHHSIAVFITNKCRPTPWARYGEVRHGPGPEGPDRGYRTGAMQDLAYGFPRISIALCSDIGPPLRCSKQASRGRHRNTRHGYAGQCNKKRSNIIDYRFKSGSSTSENSVKAKFAETRLEELQTVERPLLRTPERSIDNTSQRRNAPSTQRDYTTIFLFALIESITIAVDHTWTF